VQFIAAVSAAAMVKSRTSDSVVMGSSPTRKAVE